MLKTRLRVALGALALLLVVAGCKSPLPPMNPMPQPPRPPTSSTPTMPSPTPPSMPAPPSRPSPGPSMPDPGVPSQPQVPQVSLPSPDLPGPPGERGQAGKKGEKSKRKGQLGSPDGSPDGEGDPGNPMEENAEERQQAGEDLQKAADEVAGMGGDEPYDPLIQSTPEKPGEDGDFGNSDDPTDDDPMLAENDRSGDSNAMPGLPVSDAMAEAAEALRKAGIEVASATSEEDLRAAEEALAEAQVAIIVAEDGLEDLRKAGHDVDTESEALAEAERSIIVASRAVIASRAELPNLPQGGSGPPDELDVALEDSLIIFDGEMEEVRRAGGGRPAPEGPTVASLPTRMPENEADTATILAEAPDALPEPEGQIAAANVPDDIGDGQDDDIIARQLREAAIAEADPALQEKLWEEYRRYKQGTR